MISEIGLVERGVLRSLYCGYFVPRDVAAKEYACLNDCGLCVGAGVFAKITDKGRAFMATRTPIVRRKRARQGGPTQ